MADWAEQGDRRRRSWQHLHQAKVLASHLIAKCTGPAVEGAGTCVVLPDPDTGTVTGAQAVAGACLIEMAPLGIVQCSTARTAGKMDALLIGYAKGITGITVVMAAASGEVIIGPAGITGTAQAIRIHQAGTSTSSAMLE